MDYDSNIPVDFSSVRIHISVSSLSFFVSFFLFGFLGSTESMFYFLFGLMDVDVDVDVMEMWMRGRGEERRKIMDK